MKKAACGGVRLSSPSLYHPLSVCLSVHPYRFLFFFFLPSRLSLLFLYLSTLLGFNHCCNWQLPAVHVLSHKHTHARVLCLAAANPSGNVYACVLWGQERERYGEIRIMKEGEFQNYRPTHQLHNLSAV